MSKTKTNVNKSELMDFCLDLDIVSRLEGIVRDLGPMDSLIKSSICKSDRRQWEDTSVEEFFV